MKPKNYYIERVAAIIAAIIFLQTLYYKFTAHPDSVMLFTQLGAEPYGRIALGAVELISSILLLYRKTAQIGAAIGLLLMLGAIFIHITKIGINFNNDGGTLFALACVTLACCTTVLVLKRLSTK